MFASASWGSGSYIPMPDEQLEQDIPTVCIVDDEASIRASLVDLFESAGMRAVAYQSADDFLDRADLSQAGCILLDVHMPGLNGLDLQSRLAAAGCFMPIVFMTGRGTVSMSVQAMKAGASDFLLKPFENAELMEATREAITRNIERREAAATYDAICATAKTLTPPERAVMKYVGEGLMNKQIAHQMQIGETMVKLHRRQMMKKMQVGSLAELVKKLDLVAGKFDIYQ
jgi:FixJ family two-component response regulator